MVDAVTATQSQQIANSRTRIADNFETFLALLTAQLKNQDPLSPMDSNAFTQQIVQMTGVEQQLLTNDLLSKLVDNASRGLGEAVSVLGKEVSAVASNRVLKDGEAEWLYHLGEGAKTVKLEVLDANGRVVRTLVPEDAKAGENTFTWDGKTDDGRELGNGGVYTLQVTAKDASNQTVSSRVLVKGIVTGVETTDGATMLTVNGAKVPWNAVIGIHEPGGQTPPEQA
ncbi:MAG TPA: flagellar hook capping FlgD N-terminal domain-containing protein [Phenylobacterium sp.]|nr:flagellar hook capping FlgD N-terminal domain-containing protein [Phenylobacterium sp.]